MMKWKVVKNPRSLSAERSLECLKNDVQLNNINNTNKNYRSNDTNNNNEDSSNKQDDNNNPSLPGKDTNRQRDSRSPLLGHVLSRQRSETDLTGIGLAGSEHRQRRSRSEARGSDRLTVGYHHQQNQRGKTRSSSPNAWPPARGRWRERTVVAGSGRNGERTVAEGRVKKRREAIEEEIYEEVRSDCSRNEKNNWDVISKGSCAPDNREVFSKGNCALNNNNSSNNNREDVSKGSCPNNNKEIASKGSSAPKNSRGVARKKGMAPKPQIVNNSLLDAVRKTSCESPTGNQNQPPVRKNQHHQTKVNHLVRVKNNINQSRSVLAVVEVHKVDSPSGQKNKTEQECTLENRNEKNNKTDYDPCPVNGSVPSENVLASSPGCVENVSAASSPGCSENISASCSPARSETVPVARSPGCSENVLDEPMPFYIDTPDYSTLESTTGKDSPSRLSTKDLAQSGKEETVHCDERLVSRETSSLSSILREGKESEHKKTVRFETLELIDKTEKTSNGDQDLTDRQQTEGQIKEDVNTPDLAKDLIEKYQRQKTEGLTREDGSAASNYATDLIDRYTRQKAEGLAQKEEEFALVSTSPAENVPKASSTRSEHISGTSRDVQGRLENVLDTFREGERHPENVLESYRNGQRRLENVLETFRDVQRRSENISSNEIDLEESSSTDKQCRPFGDCANSMTVLVRNCAPPDSSQLVVKKSFVLTVAKQEKGFRSLCEHKKPEPISVTFRCQRSTSVPPPPRSLPPVAVIPLPAARGRSRERRPKERQHGGRKSHRARKKDSVFVMPQAVIDELSQVLEKRKPSLDEINPHP